MMAEPRSSPGAAMVAPEIARKRGLIQQLLDDDAEIRRHTEPWMEHVRKLLGGPWSPPPGAASLCGADSTPDTGFESVSRS